MQSTIIKKVIHGYEVELELNPEVEWSDCWVTKGQFHGSLQRLESEGTLSDSYWNDLEVSPHTIEVISKWAEKNGY